MDVPEPLELRAQGVDLGLGLGELLGVLALVDVCPALGQLFPGGLDLCVQSIGTGNLRRFPAQFLVAGVQLRPGLLQIGTMLARNPFAFQFIDMLLEPGQFSLLFQKRTGLLLLLLPAQVDLPLEIDQIIFQSCHLAA